LTQPKNDWYFYKADKNIGIYFITFVIVKNFKYEKDGCPGNNYHWQKKNYDHTNSLLLINTEQAKQQYYNEIKHGCYYEAIGMWNPHGLKAGKYFSGTGLLISGKKILYLSRGGGDHSKPATLGMAETKELEFHPVKPRDGDVNRTKS
jgi:hypothetical protein